MATFYVGPRPVLAGENTNNWVHIYKGNKVGIYSNYQLMNTGAKVLTGAPDNERFLGTDGKVRRVRLLEWLYSGHIVPAPLDNPGNGTRIAGARFRPLEYKGTIGSLAFPPGYGHSTTFHIYYEEYNNYLFDGFPSAETLPSATTGHPHRLNATYGGAFDPYLFHGTAGSVAMPGTIGQPNVPSIYGRYRINEWNGTPSQKAL